VLTGALEAPGSELLGKDAGVLAGLPKTASSCRPTCGRCRKDADGILDFTVPGATIANVAIAAERGLVHVIGTTGLSASDDAVIKSVTSRAIVVKSGNMSLGVNLLAALVKRVAQSLDDDFDIEISRCITGQDRRAVGHRAAARRGRRRRRARSRSRALGARPRRRHRRARSGDIGFASLRGGTVTGDHSVIFAGPPSASS
jgi:4-hydroxy-tetrahydrodipicolinate reductase